MPLTHPAEYHLKVLCIRNEKILDVLFHLQILFKLNLTACRWCIKCIINIGKYRGFYNRSREILTALKLCRHVNKFGNHWSNETNYMQGWLLGRRTSRRLAPLPGCHTWCLHCFVKKLMNNSIATFIRQVIMYFKKSKNYGRKMPFYKLYVQFLVSFLNSNTHPCVLASCTGWNFVSAPARHPQQFEKFCPHPHTANQHPPRRPSQPALAQHFFGLKPAPVWKLLKTHN